MGVYIWTNELKNAYIGERKGFVPGGNTLLYLPLNSTSTHTDKSWNNRGTTNYSVQFWTYQWVDCGYFNNAHIQVTSFNMPSTHTFLVWFYRTGFNTSDWKLFDSRPSPQYVHWINSVSSEWTFWYVWNTVVVSWVQTDNKWCLYAMSISWSSATLTLLWNGVNTVKTASVSAPSGTPSYINIWNEYNNAYNRYFLWYMSQLILENKAWSSQEILDYYNATKSNYGL